MNPDIVLIADCVVIAVVFGLISTTMSAGTLPRNNSLGIRTGQTTKSDEAWKIAHATAAPFVTGVAIIGCCGAAFGTLALTVKSLGLHPGIVTGTFLGLALVSAAVGSVRAHLVARDYNRSVGC